MVCSIGQYQKSPDYVKNVLFEDIRVDKAFNAAFIKTWQGVPVDNSSNGHGGGGSGYVRNVTFRNFLLDQINLPIQITQCIYSEADPSLCESSKMAISDITWQNITGTTTYNIAASLHCALGHPCPGIQFVDVALQSRNKSMGLPNWGVDSQAEVFQCANLVNPTGIPCNKVAPANFSQWVFGNLP
jgi:galacturan 1,4-alpha-galacturonidase